MNPVKTMTGVVTRPVHTAASVAGRAIGLSIGATKAGVRTTGRIVEWAADRGLSAPERTTAPPTTTPPATTSGPATTPAPAATAATRTAAPGDTVDRDATTTETAPEPTVPPSSVSTSSEPSSVPTPADVKPAIDRSAPLEAEPPEVDSPEASGAAEDADDVRTASGIPAAGVGVNPATGEPNRYDTEPVLDPATAKAVRSETEVLRRAAEDEPGAAAEPARRTANKTADNTAAKTAKKAAKKPAKKPADNG